MQQEAGSLKWRTPYHKYVSASTQKDSKISMTDSHFPKFRFQYNNATNADTVSCNRNLKILIQDGRRHTDSMPVSSHRTRKKAFPIEILFVTSMEAEINSTILFSLTKKHDLRNAKWRTAVHMYPDFSPTTS